MVPPYNTVPTTTSRENTEHEEVFKRKPTSAGQPSGTAVIFFGSRVVFFFCS